MLQIKQHHDERASMIDINPGRIIPACQSEAGHTGPVDDSGRGQRVRERLEFLQI